MDDFPITYYCLELDGSLRTHTSSILITPHKRPFIEKTAFGDVSDYRETKVEFIRGTYECYEKWIADYLDVYTSGGYWSPTGKDEDKQYVKPNSWAFLISREDPSNKVITKTIIEKEQVNKMVLPESLVNSFSIKQLEETLISNGIELSGVTPTKSSYIELLKSNGHIV